VNYAPVLFVFIPVITAVIIYLFKKIRVSFVIFGSQALLAVLFVFYLFHLNANPDDALIVFGGWDERFAISFYIDQLTLIFVGLTLFMWVTVLLYTYRINKRERNFLFFLLFLEGVFMGLLQTNDLFNLFVFLELVTVLVTILIAYKKSGQSFRAAIYYLLINTLGAMFFLIGIIFLYYAYGTINIQIILANIATHSDTNLVKLAYVFMVGGISIKAAFFPVFTWLPRAHGVAQSTISALLSGLVVKSALYIFIRVNNQMFALANYSMDEVFFWIGAVTATIGVLFALSQKDLKQILAYHTISQIGIIMMGLTSALMNAQVGGLLHIVNHALFKSLLFLGAGIVVKTYNSKKVKDIRGLFKTMPWTSVLLIVGMLSISGAPMFNGFVSKTLIKYSDFGHDSFKMILFAIINLGTVTSFIKFSQILFGPKVIEVQEKNIRQHISMTIIALSCLAIGIFYIPIGNAIGLDFGYVKLWDISKFLEYFIYVGLGFMLYKFVIAKDYWFNRKLRNISITFENANYLFIVYMLVLSLFMFLL
jgi:multicomponent Na+:H+ antiporter subunit D